MPSHEAIRPYYTILHKARIGISIIIIIMGIIVSGLSNVLWRGFEPSNFLSRARDYARWAVLLMGQFLTLQLDWTTYANHGEEGFT